MVFCSIFSGALKHYFMFTQCVTETAAKSAGHKLPCGICGKHGMWNDVLKL